eukprot:TRINITY_DN2375_c0_g1_i1.p1 TRINITY_DN2375_c0_g1~~TRINITY_DN2375_c0_g1_i1.p1  ORF type:complete len:227 (+),score=48.50 TRINITY_DN2375_c0_g1_i1:54-734(+)
MSSSNNKQQTLCPHYSKGKCFFGDNCKYLHSGPGGTTERPKSMTKCPFFSSGKCYYGDRCQYSHSGLPPPPSVVPPLPPYPFPSTMSGSPTSGESMAAYYAAYLYPYMQMMGAALPNGPQSSLPRLGSDKRLQSGATSGTVSQKPCRFWAEGSCTYGDACKFTHYGEAGSGIPDYLQTKRPASAMDGSDSDREKKRRRDDNDGPNTTGGGGGHQVDLQQPSGYGDY